MTDVFEQVEEELRSDRYTRLARTWLPVAGAVLAFALIAALGWWGWDSWQSSRADQASAAYDRGMEASLAVIANDMPRAIELFDQAAKAVGDPILSDIARFKALMLVMDTGTEAEIEARIEPLIKEGRPYRAFAFEAQAMSRLQFGKVQEARGILVQLQLGQDVPDSVRERAQAAISQIDGGTAASLDEIGAAAGRLPPEPTAPPQGTPVQPAPAAGQ